MHLTNDFNKKISKNILFASGLEKREVAVEFKKGTAVAVPKRKNEKEKAFSILIVSVSTRINLSHWRKEE